MKPRGTVRRSSLPTVASIVAITASLAGCGGTAITNFGDAGSSTARDGAAQGAPEAGGPPVDATLPPSDAGSSFDSGDDDAAFEDASVSFDATVPVDSGAANDAGAIDSGPTDAGPGDDDAGIDDDSGTCTVKIRRQTDAGLFCPRSKTDGGPAIDCDPASQVCCIPNQNGVASTCQNGQTCAAKEMVWACAGPNDCAGKKSGGTCCLSAGGLEPDPQCPAFDQTTGKQSTACVERAECSGMVDAAKAPSGLYVVCAKKGDCPAGTACTPVKVFGTGVGVCL